tara:strand:+ start:4921 stop:5556 length:636 start_codon:yes stop_codon:yes gene_type:complete
MFTHKKIAWQSWNALVHQSLAEEQEMLKELEEEMQSGGGVPPEGASFLPVESFQQRVLHTPVGIYPMDSLFKPSDRWDCWIGHTNFDITHAVKNDLSKVAGVEAVRILGRYTFFIGIAKLFDIKDVRMNIEKQLCVYTEREVLSDEQTQATVDMVKEQLKTKKYWSILVAPTGKVDYVVSDDLDKAYLDGLNELLELKQLLGGIILRGDYG